MSGLRTGLAKDSGIEPRMADAISFERLQKASGPTPASAGWPTDVAVKLDQNDPVILWQLGPHVVRSADD